MREMRRVSRPLAIKEGKVKVITCVLQQFPDVCLKTTRLCVQKQIYKNTIPIIRQLY